MTKSKAGRVFHTPTSREEMKFVAGIIWGVLVDSFTPYTGSPLHRFWMQVRDYVYPYRETS